MVDSTKGNVMPPVYPDYHQSVPEVEQPEQATKGKGETNYQPLGSVKLEPITGTNHSDNNPPPPNAGFWGAMGASMGSTYRDWSAYVTGESVFEPDNQFIPNVKTHADEWFAKNGRFTPEETAYINGAVSLDDFNYRTERLLDDRMRQQAMGDSLAGSLIGGAVDIDIMANFLPMLGQVKWGQRLALAGGAGAVAYGMNELNEDTSIRPEWMQNLDIGIFGASALFGTGFKGIRGTRVAGVLDGVLDDAVETELNAIRGSGAVTDASRTVQPSTFDDFMPNPTPDLPPVTVRTLPEEEIIRNADGEIVTPNVTRTVDDVVEDTVDDSVTPIASQRMYDPKVIGADEIIDITKGGNVNQLYRSGRGARTTLADNTPVRIITTNDPKYKHKYTLSIFDENTGNRIASLTYFDKGGARAKHTDLGISPSYNRELLEEVLYQTATANGGKLPISKTTQAKHTPSQSVMNFTNTQHAKATGATNQPIPLTTPAGTQAHLNQSIANATQTIVNQQNAKVAQSGGSLGTVSIMGVNLPIPLNVQPPINSMSKINSITPIPPTTPKANGGATPPPKQNQPLPVSADMPDRWQAPDFYKNTVGKWIESTADTLFRLTENITDQISKTRLRHLLADYRTQGANATYHASAVQAELVATLIPFEDKLLEVVRKRYGTSGWQVWQRDKHRQNLQVEMKSFQASMQAVDRNVQQRIRAGLTVTDADVEQLIKQSGADTFTQDLMFTYSRSGFAPKAYDHMVRVGLITDEMKDQIPRRTTYIPIRHSYEKLDAILKELSDADILYKFLGEQIMHMYPASQGKQFSLTAKQLGQNFVRNQETLETNLAEISSTGISADAMRQLLSTTNLSKQDIDDVLKTLVPQMNNQGSNAFKHLRQRIDWDFNLKSAPDPKTGKTITMSDIIDNDVVLNLNDYARGTSKRVGLAHYGVMSPAELDDLLKQVVRDRPKDTSIDEVEAFVRNVKDSLLGLPTGEPLAPTVRTLNTLGSSMVLSGSGIWQIMDVATQTMRLGLLRTLPQIVKGLKHATRALKGTSKADADDLYSILTQRLSAEGRWRGLSMRYEDNFSVHSGIHESIAHAGQSVRFLNFSESIKRFQVGLMGGIFVSAFEGVAKGRAKDVRFLKDNLKMSDELIRGIADQYSKHGGAIDNWEAGIRVAMEQKVFFEADNLAYTIRTGELPAFLEHSSVGKALFPFMSFTMSMQNKLLDNTYKRDGFVGLAKLALVQLPMSVLLGMVNNVKNGKDPEEDLASSSVSAMSMLGIWNIPLNAFLNDGFRGGGTIFTPFNKLYQAGNTLLSDEATHAQQLSAVQEATPFAGATTALHMAISILDED